MFFRHRRSRESDSLCSQLDHSKANSQIAIVTVHDLDGDDAADWANQLEDAWKIGKKGWQQGVLVLLAVDVHKYRIDVAYGLEGILNDAKVGDIGRSMVPYLRSRDYDSAITMAVGQVAQTIAADAGVTLTNEPQEQAQPQVRHSGGVLPFLLFILIFLFFGGFTIFRILAVLGLFGGGFRGGPWMGSGWAAAVEDLAEEAVVVEADLAGLAVEALAAAASAATSTCAGRWKL